MKCGWYFRKVKLLLTLSLLILYQSSTISYVHLLPEQAGVFFVEA